MPQMDSILKLKFQDLFTAIFSNVNFKVFNANWNLLTLNVHSIYSYNEPQKLEWKNATKEEVLPSKYELKQNALVTFLMNMKTGTKVFQHFLMKTNLSHLIDGKWLIQTDAFVFLQYSFDTILMFLIRFDTEKAYTILIPVDSAFQRWHPIDWGFYPFSVSEFTENILRNHFLQLKAPIRMQDIKKATEISKVKTMGGEMVTFRNSRKNHYFFLTKRILILSQQS